MNMMQAQTCDISHELEVRNPYNDKLVDCVPKDTRFSVDRAIETAASYDFHLTAWQRYEMP